MPVRKSMEEVLVLDGTRADVALQCMASLSKKPFKNPTHNTVVHQLSAKYGTMSVSGNIAVTLHPEGEMRTRVVAVSTAAADNVWALLKSPNKEILGSFKEGLSGA